MNTSLSTFMSVVVVALILFSLLIGVVTSSLESKNASYHSNLNQYQIKPK